MSATLWEAESGPWSVSEFGQSIGLSLIHGQLAMIAAYFDESGTHDQSKVVTISGVVGPISEWVKLEAPWKAELAKVPGVSHFHATDCERKRREFKEVPDPMRHALQIQLATRLAARRLVVVGGSVYREDWESASPDLRRAYGDDPYYFCFILVLQQLNELSIKHADGAPISMVFAEQQMYEKTAAQIYEFVKGTQNYSHLGSMTIMKPKCLFQLQAADLVAYETYQELFHQLARADASPKRAPLRIIAESMPYESVFFDKAALAEIALSARKAERDY